MRMSHFKENIWRCNLSPADVKNIRIKNTFWQDVLCCWCEFNYNNGNRVENQIVWYNSNIRIRDKPFFWLDAYQKGLMYVHQLFQDQHLKSEQQIQQEFGITTLRYNSLKVSIPNWMKEYFLETPKEVYLPSPPHNFDAYKYSAHLAARIYRYLGDDVLLIHNKYIKWRDELGESLCEGLGQFGTKHAEIYRVTNMSKLRSFQYRLLQRGLVTNIHLHQWGVIPDNLCSYCKEQPETLTHLFADCKESLKLWRNLEKHIQERFNISNLTLTRKSIILNEIDQSRFSVINFLCLITKQFIYRQRCLGKSIDFPILKAEIKKIESIEKYIATKNGKIHIHERKWRIQ